MVGHAVDMVDLNVEFGVISAHIFGISMTWSHLF